MFCDKLNEYMLKVSCSAKELSRLCGISEATISRYRSGERTPDACSPEMEKLCRGICAAAEQRGAEGIVFEEVFEALCGCLGGGEFDYDTFRIKLNMLFSSLEINAAEMSRTLKYDSSYISRIRSGQRKPTRPEIFARAAADYIARSCGGDSDKKIVSQMIGKQPDDFNEKNKYALCITEWLTDGAPAEKEKNPMSEFLEKLDSFDLNEYIRSIGFDDLKVPTLPFQLPSSRSYYGIEEMKMGELDFLKATALSRASEEVFMCSDMQMDDMAADMDFSRKYMFGLAAMLKKGLHLNVVHNLCRPFDEIMLGLVCWIPLYMTGQISPYYLKGEHNRIFCHFLNVSGAAALSGESIAGFHDKGKYYLTKIKDEKAYYRERAKCILEKALPLMEIYKEDRKNAFEAFLISQAQVGGNRKGILSAPPVYTMTDDFLKSFLKKRSVGGELTEKILLGAAESRNRVLKILENNFICDDIPDISKEEFLKRPVSLSLPFMFCAESFEYTYEEFVQHCILTDEFCKKQKNYTVKHTGANEFRNIQIFIQEKKCVVISKNNSPAIHFVLKHPTLVDAIEKMEFPLLK